MADKYTALKEDAEFLWEHGRTHNGTADSEKEATARGERYRERAVRTFYRLGDFSREEMRNTDIWRYTLLFLMGTLKDARECAANLIEHYKGPLARLQSAMNRQRKRLESAGVKVPET